ncbi:MAG: putative iron binding protein [Candidatus Carbobacillus altaicus]|uniref:Putative iron binding protein n=1 Tax=Candidatus Carbonibacillus altaicus TaxID=2163959 RepID=A0A2R6Y4L1_9BACL|nr:MAG: putative iron binding protein [Candidatus Carbobacillus altaicus]
MVMLTEQASLKIRELMQAEHVEEGYLRLGVQPSCCSGFSYGLSLELKPHDTDQIIEQHGVRLVVDETSLPYVDGVEIDFIQDGHESGFAIRNPKAIPSCGCGSSFRLAEEA